jgi:predicted amidohydrolase
VSYTVAVAQLKPKKADYQHNLARVAGAFEQVAHLAPRPDVLVLPETAMSGYFLEGGVRESSRTAQELFTDLLARFRGCFPPDAALDVVVGFYEAAEGRYYNSALYATLSGTECPEQARIVHVHRKFFLPTYGVFDEKRFVARGRTIAAFSTRLGPAAMLICEDAWHSVSSAVAALQGALSLYVLSASPGRGFEGATTGNLQRWDRLLPGIAEEHNVFVVYAGLVGFEGGKGFTGSSRIVDPWGAEVVRGPVAGECLLTGSVDLDLLAAARAGTPLLMDLESNLGDLSLMLDRLVRGPHELLGGSL